MKHKIKVFAMAFAVVFSGSVLAAADSDSTATYSARSDENSKECKNIVLACKHAGYGRKHGEGKAFWFDCMKPILLGKSVANVNVSASDVDACKKFKIQKMQEELQEFQQSQSSSSSNQ